MEIDNTNLQSKLGKAYYDYKDTVISLTVVLQKYLKSLMKELEDGIPSIQFEMAGAGDMEYTYSGVAWKCFHCKFLNKDGNRKDCQVCKKQKKIK